MQQTGTLFTPKIIKSTNKVFFGSRQSGKTYACIQKFIEYFPNVVYVTTHNNLINREIAEKIYTLMKNPPNIADLINRHMWTLEKYDNPQVKYSFRNYYKIIDDVEILDIIHQANKQQVKEVIIDFDFITSSDGRFIDLFNKIYKQMKLDAILE